MRRIAALVVLLAATLSPAASAPGARLYLLAGPDRTTLWTTDLSDPGAQEPRTGFGCPLEGGVNLTPCGSQQSNQTLFVVSFSPGMLLDSTLSWTAATAPRFHFELDVVMTTGTYSVYSYVNNGTRGWVSDKGTEVAPGVFEGTLPAAASLDPGKVTQMGVGVRAEGHFRGYSVRTAGASYVDLAEPIAAATMRELEEQSTYAPSPGAFASIDRTFTFNDDQWEVIEFIGNTSTPKTVPLSLGAEAAAVFAYVDDWSSPPVHSAGHLRPDARTLARPVLELRKGAVVEAHALRAIATPSLPAGDYELSIARPTLEDAGVPPIDVAYKGYIVIVRGERTLRSMRFRFFPSTLANISSPVANNGGDQIDEFVAPAEATLMSFDFAVDSVNPAHADWYTYWTLGGYGGGSARDGTRAILGPPAAGRLSAYMTRGEVMVSAQETAFDVTIEYSYTAP